MILDRSPGIAIPDESYFVPQLAHRHRDAGRLPARFVDDLRRLPHARYVGVSTPTTSLPRSVHGMTTGEALGAVFAAYAAKRRQGALGRQDPDVHAAPAAARAAVPGRAVRASDPRRARRALSFLAMPDERADTNLGPPRRTPAGFACQWGTEVGAARRWARAVGATSLPRGPLRGSSSRTPDGSRASESARSPALPFEPQMLESAEAVDARGEAAPPAAASTAEQRRDWRPR